jgi:hypothetical protein
MSQENRWLDDYDNIYSSHLFEIRACSRLYTWLTLLSYYFQHADKRLINIATFKQRIQSDFHSNCTFHEKYWTKLTVCCSSPTRCINYLSLKLQSYRLVYGRLNKSTKRETNLDSRATCQKWSENCHFP